MQRKESLVHQNEGQNYNVKIFNILKMWQNKNMQG
jgi:hypothetical protein